MESIAFADLLARRRSSGDLGADDIAQQKSAATEVPDDKANNKPANQRWLSWLWRYVGSSNRAC